MHMAKQLKSRCDQMWRKQEEWEAESKRLKEEDGLYKWREATKR